MAFCAKIVPDNDLHAEGEWIVIYKANLPEGLAQGRLYHWVQKYLPHGKHAVQLVRGDKIPSPG